MAISHIHVTSVYVSNQDNAVDFYVNKLGFEKRRDEPFGYGDVPNLRWIEVAPPGAQTGIVLIERFGGWTEEMVGSGTGLSMTVKDTFATCEEFKRKGVEFIEEPNQQPWGVQAQVKDQDGNRIVLVGD